MDHRAQNHFLQYLQYTIYLVLDLFNTLMKSGTARYGTRILEWYISAHFNHSKYLIS